MSLFSFPKSFKNYDLLSHFSHLFFSICLDPLSFSYFIFILLFPYLFRLLSFLSPLIITTTLLLAPLLSLTSPTSPVHENYDSESSKSHWGFLLSVFHSYIQWLRSKTHHLDGEFGSFHEFEAYVQTLHQSIFEVSELVHACSRDQDATDYSSEGSEDFGPEKEPQCVNSEEIPMENLDGANYSSEGTEELGQEKEPCTDSEDIVVEKVDDNLEAIGPIKRVRKSVQTLFQETKELVDMSCQKEDKVKPQVVESNEKVLCSNLENFGSIRSEKRWKRTLACKLLEERRSASVIEGMDILRETLDTYSTDVQRKEEEVAKEREMGCFQGLNLSVGTISLGMKKSNFFKISKALGG